MRNVKGFKKYSVLEDGKIISYHGKEPKTMKTDKKISNGYESVILCNGNEQKTFKVHRLVALAFLPNPLGLREVNHKDGNKRNNNADNLEWVTSSENKKHMHNYVLRRPGTSHKSCKLYECGKLIKEFEQIQDACTYVSDKYGISYQSFHKYQKSKKHKLVLKV